MQMGGAASERFQINGRHNPIAMSSVVKWDFECHTANKWGESGHNKNNLAMEPACGDPAVEDDSNWW